MIDISSDAYWYSEVFVYNPENKSRIIDNGWFPNFGQYNSYFGSGSVTPILNYIGESLIGKTLFIHNENIGIIVYYGSNQNENSVWWGSNDGYDAEPVQTIDGVASIFIAKDIYGIGVLIQDGDGYVGSAFGQTNVVISSIQLSDSSKWTNFRNAVEVTT